MEAAAQYGYWGLFAVSFLAATILPFSSEVVLVYLLIQGFHPPAVLAAATSGNVLGAVVNYWIGSAGSLFLLHRVLGMSESGIEAARNRFKRYGTASLLLAWVPVIGDPLTVAAGMLKIHFGLFVLLVMLGKAGRYLVIGWTILSG